MAATAASNLTLAQFEQKFAHADRAYELWYGEAIPKPRPTRVHGLLQNIIMRLLEQEAGFHAACEVEVRIDAEAHPRPDVIASKSKAHGAYPMQAVEIVVEIVSDDCHFQN